MMMTIAALYLMFTFVILRFCFRAAEMLIKLGAVAGGLILLKSCNAEVSMIIVIVAMVYIIKRFFIQL